ncbi:MAG: SDR family NAD(P)-dependent oxidoreductase [Gaiellaceae bacterium]
MRPTRTVLVTGASSGIGAACSRRLATAGWDVLAGVRSPGDAPEGTTEVILDVTDAEAIRAASERIETLHGLVDNAGIAVAAPLELLPLDELRRQLEVNLIGQLAVTQACLPALRRGYGRIVIVGSIAGRSALPFLGAYAISKFGLEALADSLRLELAPDGISVSIVAPGTIATPIWSKPQRVVDAMPAEALERYSSRLRTFRTLAAARAAKATPAESVAAAIEHALRAPRPRTRYLVGRDARLRAAVELLPDRLRDRVLERVLFEEGGRAPRW